MRSTKSRLFILALICCAPLAEAQQVILRDPLEDTSGSNLLILSSEDTTSGNGSLDPDITIDFGADYANKMIGDPEEVTGAPFPAGIPEAPNTQPGDMPRRGLYLSANDELFTNPLGLSEIAAIPVDPNSPTAPLSVIGNYEVQVDVWMNYDKGSAVATEFGGLLVGHDGATAGRLTGGGLIYSGDSGAASDFRLQKGPPTGVGDPNEGGVGQQRLRGDEDPQDPDNLLNADGQYNPEIALAYYADPQFDPNFGIGAALDNENDFWQEAFTNRVDLEASFAPYGSQGTSQTGPSGVNNPPGDPGFRWGTIRIEVSPDEMGVGTRDAAGVARVYLSGTWQDDGDGDISTEDPITVTTPEELFIGTVDNSIDTPDAADNTPDVLDFSNPIALVYSDLFVSFEGSGFNFGVFDNLLVTAMGGDTIKGDMNGDGEVNFGDLSPFALGLTDIPAYEAAFPDVDRVAAGDVSMDEQFNFGDLSPFVDLLTNPGGSSGGAAVPEPTAGWLLTLGLAWAATCRASGQHVSVFCASLLKR